MTKKPTKASIKALDRIIWNLEAWQNRQDTKDMDHHDTNKAKNLLMGTLNKMIS